MNIQYSEAGLAKETSPSFMNRVGVDRAFNPTDWQRILFREFEANLLSETRSFPCIFGVAGFRADQLRYSFLDPLNARNVAAVLGPYLSESRGLAPIPRSSYSVGRDRSSRLKLTNEGFGDLCDLAVEDHRPWPIAIPEELDNPRWEFCFAGEPIFVVCNTPAHVSRQSRRASSFMITFQPRWSSTASWTMKYPPNAHFARYVIGYAGMTSLRHRLHWDVMATQVIGSLLNIFSVT